MNNHNELNKILIDNFSSHEQEKINSLLANIEQSSDVLGKKIVHELLTIMSAFNHNWVLQAYNQKIVDQLFQSLSEQNHQKQVLLEDELPYLTPDTLHRKDMFDFLQTRLQKVRYNVPHIYKTRVKQLLINTCNMQDSINNHLLYNVYQFIREHTTAKDTKKHPLKRKEETSEKLLLRLELLCKDQKSIAKKSM